MATMAMGDNGPAYRQEYLVTFGRSKLGEAFGAFRDRGITREIHCYPGRRLLLLQQELEALHEEGVFEDEAVPIKSKV